MCSPGSITTSLLNCTGLSKQVHSLQRRLDIIRFRRRHLPPQPRLNCRSQRHRFPNDLLPNLFLHRLHRLHLPQTRTTPTATTCSIFSRPLGTRYQFYCARLSYRLLRLLLLSDCDAGNAADDELEYHHVRGDYDLQHGLLYRVWTLSVYPTCSDPE